MSKISIKPNDSGTATFEIQAPATNTDRVIELPDSAGELYNQGNILGTVSESGGVPTGAIIERGSNANGEFIKYADGTMICLITTSVFTTNLAFATGLAFSAGITRTYPAAFLNTDIRLASARSAETAANGWANTAQVSTTECRTRAFSASTSSTGINTIIAIGRWY